MTVQLELERALVISIIRCKLVKIAVLSFFLAVTVLSYVLAGHVGAARSQTSQIFS